KRTADGGVDHDDVDRGGCVRRRAPQAEARRGTGAGAVFEKGSAVQAGRCGVEFRHVFPSFSSCWAFESCAAPARRHFSFGVSAKPISDTLTETAMITTPTAGRNGAIWSMIRVQRWTGIVRCVPMTRKVRTN